MESSNPGLASMASGTGRGGQGKQLIEKLTPFLQNCADGLKAQGIGQALFGLQVRENRSTGFCS